MVLILDKLPHLSVEMSYLLKRNFIKILSTSTDITVTQEFYT